MAGVLEFSRTQTCDNVRCKVAMMKLEALTRMFAQDVELALNQTQCGASVDAQRTLQAIVDKAYEVQLLVPPARFASLDDASIAC